MGIRVGILGYGNLGRGVEKAVTANPDEDLVGVFTRRDPKNVSIASDSVKVYSADALEKMTEEIDVLVICGGSATDLPVLTPKYASLFNVVDSWACSPLPDSRHTRSFRTGRITPSGAEASLRGILMRFDASKASWTPASIRFRSQRRWTKCVPA